jgi:hypothetical protein
MPLGSQWWGRQPVDAGDAQAQKPVTAKARPTFKSAVGQACRDCAKWENPMKVQIAVQCGKSFKASVTVVLSTSLVLALIAMLV